MKQDELRLLQTVKDLVTGHNSLFARTQEHISTFDDCVVNIHSDIHNLENDVKALQLSRSVQREEISAHTTQIKDISERLSVAEQELKDAISDIRSVERELMSYQQGCGRIITEIMMRLDRLENGQK